MNLFCLKPGLSVQGLGFGLSVVFVLLNKSAEWVRNAPNYLQLYYNYISHGGTLVLIWSASNMNAQLICI